MKNKNLPRKFTEFSLKIKALSLLHQHLYLSVIFGVFPW